MKTNTFFGLMGIIVIAAVVAIVASCGGGGSPHEHDFGTAWKRDATHHWHECTADGEKSDYDSHKWHWKITVHPTEEEDGLKTKTCSICDYESDETESISAGTIVPACDNTECDCGDDCIGEGCNCDEDAPIVPTTYIVTFNSNGGSDVAPITGITSGTTINEPTAPVKGIGYEFDNWYLDTETTPFSFDTPITANITLNAKWNLTLAIGDTGPGGGKIFYRSEDSFTMTDDNSTAHYLEAAPADMPESLKWSTQSSDPNPWINVTDTEEAIGTGRKNTALIVTADPYVDYDHAALACDKYSNGGKDDWFLPSKDELNELYKSKDAVGMVIATSGNAKNYWSSSQGYISGASFQNFSDGVQNILTKFDALSVRAVRAF